MLTAKKLEIEGKRILRNFPSSVVHARPRLSFRTEFPLTEFPPSDFGSMFLGIRLPVGKKLSGKINPALRKIRNTNKKTHTK